MEPKKPVPEGYVYLPPDTSLIQSERRSNMKWSARFGEFIDNSFDAKATRVVFEFTNRQLIISDDGIGCANPHDMLQHGRHTKHTSTMLGRYGVGCKQAALSTAENFEIHTVHNGIMRSVVCHWQDLEKMGGWWFPPVAEMPSDGGKGTKIILSTLISAIPQDKDKLINELSLTYTPAIEKGRQIVVSWNPKRQPVTVPQFVFPPLENQRTDVFAISGKTVRVRMGIIPHGHPVKRSGLIVAHGFRVIKPQLEGKLSESPIPNLFGWVELLDGWILTKHKDNIAQNEDQLADEIRHRFRDVIKIAEERGTSIMFANIGDKITKALQQMSNNKKAKRDNSDSVGTVLPTNSGAKHKQAKKTQAGSRFGGDKNAKAASVSVVFVPFGSKDTCYRWSNNNAIELNSDLEYIQRLESKHDMVTLLAAIITAAHYRKDKRLYTESELAAFETMNDQAAKIFESLSQPQEV